MKKIFTGVLFCFLVVVSPAKAQKITGVGPVAITVSDMDRALAFYTGVLPFKNVGEQELFGKELEDLEGVFGIRVHIVTLQLGDEQIQLVDYLTAGGRPVPADARSNDLSFQHIAIVVSDMEKAYSLLRECGVEHVSTGPQTLPKSIPGAEGIKAFYFHDPDRHNLELIYFPEGKGDFKWQHSEGKLFLGIDHTAIGISQTDRSLSFYRDLLGLERKGESWNRGTEQEHLNNVKGASLHITGLRSAAGPGVEFLQYLVPGPGKSYPADTRADDIWYWQTTLWTDDAVSLYKKLKEKKEDFVSERLVVFTSNPPGYRKAFVVKDKDGHALLIAEK